MEGDGFSKDKLLQYHSSPFCYLPQPSISNSLGTTSSMSMVFSPMPSHKKSIATQGCTTTTTTTTTSAATPLPSPHEQKDGSGSKSRKQKRGDGCTRGVEGNKRARRPGDVKANEPCREPSSDYIHVRARRGQATDSHSLAERVRREKISERMKMLQSLVPGCDKVTGKALMLDEIINYVQSLQNQVEFLSMKLASISPVLYELGVDISNYQNFPGLLKMASMPHELAQCFGQPNQAISGEQQHTPFDGTISLLDNQVATNTDAPLISPPQGPTPFAQDGSSRMMPPPLSQAEFNSMCPFQ